MELIQELTEHQYIESRDLPICLNCIHCCRTNLYDNDDFMDTVYECFITKDTGGFYTRIKLYGGCNRFIVRSDDLIDD